MGDLADHELGRNEATRLWELRLQAEEERLDALLDCGEHQKLVAELMAAVDAEPFREARWAQLMVALYRSGRQGEALRTYQRLQNKLSHGPGHPAERSAVEPGGLDTAEPARAGLGARWPEPEEAPSGRRDDRRDPEDPPARAPARPAYRETGREASRGGSAEGRVQARRRRRWARGTASLRRGGSGQDHPAGRGGPRRFRSGGAHVLFGHCEEDLASPYQLFSQALGHYFAHVADEELLGQPAVHGPELLQLVPSLANRVHGPAPSKATGTDAERYLLFASVVDLLATMSNHSPVVLVLDDLQWADRASLQLLRHIIAAERPMRLLVMGAYRDSELFRAGPLVETLGALRRHRDVAHIALSGLDHAGVISLMESAAGHPLDEAGRRLAHAISLETDGNPFFVTEVLRHLLETGAISRDVMGRWVAVDTLDGTALPDSVRQVIDARIVHLGRDAGRVLSMAAVIGVEFDLDLLAKATRTPEDDLLEVLDAGAAAALVRELPGPTRELPLCPCADPEDALRGPGTDPTGSGPRERWPRRWRSCAEGRRRRRAGELARHWSLTARPGDLRRALDAARRAADIGLGGARPG